MIRTGHAEVASQKCTACGNKGKVRCCDSLEVERRLLRSLKSDTGTPMSKMEKEGKADGGDAMGKVSFGTFDVGIPLQNLEASL